MVQGPVVWVRVGFRDGQAWWKENQLLQVLLLHALPTVKQTNVILAHTIGFYADVKKNEIMMIRKIDTNGNH